VHSYDQISSTFPNEFPGVLVICAICALLIAQFVAITYPLKQVISPVDWPISILRRHATV